MIFDPTMLLLLPAILLTLYAQWKVQSTFSHYSQVGLRNGLSGAAAALQMARSRNLPVRIEPTSGHLSDHFDPQANVLRLSESVYSGRSVASIGVAAHELGHALQKAANYPFLQMRTGLVPLVGFSSNLSWLLLVGGMLLHSSGLLWVGIGLYSLAVLFALITLPVEFDASRRALAVLRQDGMVTSSEEAGVRAVLNAAALTYVAAALMAVLELLRLVLIARRSED
jgi:Zn-dependent membrane protease YugP